jgi:hypothetical protein
MADEGLIIVLKVLHQTEADLLHVALATGAARVFADAGEDGEENGGEERYDGDHHKQFDESEGSGTWGSGRNSVQHD